MNTDPYNDHFKFLILFNTFFFLFIYHYFIINEKLSHQTNGKELALLNLLRYIFLHFSFERKIYYDLGFTIKNQLRMKTNTKKKVIKKHVIHCKFQKCIM